MEHMCPVSNRTGKNTAPQSTTPMHSGEAWLRSFTSPRAHRRGWSGTSMRRKATSSADLWMEQRLTSRTTA
ncbi:unnamed protein product [Heligmosomoides polygyrus]|uniref:Uncharacterized protein n=1 Tax=Heligmosomoides polygyrus TaxID=6339 RepID=A0A3P7ZZP4_HELPZ|nr:unnamed protein product [Heligmosomoides polygyrus]